MAEKFIYTLKVTDFALFCSGVEALPSKWKGLKKQIIYKAIFIITFLWLYTDIVAELFWIFDGFKSGKSILELASVAPCAFLTFMSTVKITFMLLKNEKLLKIIQDLKDIHPDFDKDKDMPEDEKEIVTKNESFVRFISTLTLSVNGFCSISYILLPVWYMLTEYRKGNNVFIAIFLTMYPFNHLAMPWYLPTYVHQMFSSFIVTLNQTGSETMFFAFCLYLNMHFRILSIRVKNVVVDKQSETTERLKEIVKRHQILIKLANDVQDVYSFPQLYNIFTSSILICLSGFCVTFVSDPIASVVYITFLAMSLTQVSMLCYFGDMLMDSSSQFSIAAYESRWYDLDQSSKKSILFLLMRSQTPCKFSAASLADINLMTLSTILSRSWSYFTLLKTMYD